MSQDAQVVAETTHLLQQVLQKPVVVTEMPPVSGAAGRWTITYHDMSFVLTVKEADIAPPVTLKGFAVREAQAIARLHGLPYRGVVEASVVTSQRANPPVPKKPEGPHLRLLRTGRLTEYEVLDTAGAVVGIVRVQNANEASSAQPSLSLWVEGSPVLALTAPKLTFDTSLYVDESAVVNP